MEAPDSLKKRWRSQPSTGPFQTLSIRNIYKNQPDFPLMLQRGPLVPCDIYDNLKAVPESSDICYQDMHLRVSVGKQLGHGRTGTVHEVTPLDESGSPLEWSSLNLLPLVVKIASVNRNVELSREAWFYEQLKSLQGVAIPRCYGFFQIRLQSDQVNNIAPWQKSLRTDVYPHGENSAPHPGEALDEPEPMWDNNDYKLDQAPGDFYEGNLEQNRTASWDVPCDSILTEGSAIHNQVPPEIESSMPTDATDAEGELISFTAFERNGAAFDYPNAMETDDFESRPWLGGLPSGIHMIQLPGPLTDFPQERSDFQFQSDEHVSSRESVWPGHPLSLPQDSIVGSPTDQASSERTHVTHFESCVPQDFDCPMISEIEMKDVILMDRSNGDHAVSPNPLGCSQAPGSSMDLSQKTSAPSGMPPCLYYLSSDPWRKSKPGSEPIKGRKRVEPNPKNRSPVSSSALMRRRAFEGELDHRPRSKRTTSEEYMFGKTAFVLPGLQEHFSNSADYDSVEEEDRWTFFEEVDTSGNMRYHYEPHILTKEEREQGRTLRTGRWRRPKLLSILVLEKLGGHIPLNKPADLRTIERDVWDVFEDLWGLRLEQHDIAYRNILKASSSGCVCPNHGIVHEWRVADLGLCQFHKKGGKVLKHFIDFSLRTLFDRLAEGKKQ